MQKTSHKTEGVAPVGSSAVLGDTDDWNPTAWQGTKWFTVRGTSTGTYAEIWYEVDRNKLGRVTVCPAYSWKTGSPHTTLDKQLKDLLTEQQLAEKMSAAKQIHPAMLISGMAMSPNDPKLSHADGRAALQAR
jgi:hypothetical protein